MTKVQLLSPTDLKALGHKEDAERVRNNRWKLDPALLTLTCEGYEVDLERCLTGHDVLDWICHLSEKSWVTAEVLGDFAWMMEKIINPRALHRKGDRTMTSAELRERVDEFARLSETGI